jgi:hypothetical protein
LSDGGTSFSQNCGEQKFAYAQGLDDQDDTSIDAEISSLYCNHYNPNFLVSHAFSTTSSSDSVLPTSSSGSLPFDILKSTESHTECLDIQEASSRVDLSGELSNQINDQPKAKTDWLGKYRRVLSLNTSQRCDEDAPFLSPSAVLLAATKNVVIAKEGGTSTTQSGMEGEEQSDITPPLIAAASLDSRRRRQKREDVIVDFLPMQTSQLSVAMSRKR